MDQGQIVEQGKHEELLKKKGKYFELYNNQFIHENTDLI
jgi:ATP-binding cassette subfamily B protein